MIGQLGDELARRGQRKPELAGDRTDRSVALGGHMGEDADMPASERWLAADEREQLSRRPPPRPGSADDASQQEAELGEIAGGNILHLVTVTVR